MACGLLRIHPARHHLLCCIVENWDCILQKTGWKTDDEASLVCNRIVDERMLQNSQLRFTNVKIVPWNCIK